VRGLLEHQPSCGDEHRCGGDKRSPPVTSAAWFLPLTRPGLRGRVLPNRRSGGEPKVGWRRGALPLQSGAALFFLRGGSFSVFGGGPLALLGIGAFAGGGLLAFLLGGGAFALLGSGPHAGGGLLAFAFLRGGAFAFFGGGPLAFAFLLGGAFLGGGSFSFLGGGSFAGGGLLAFLLSGVSLFRAGEFFRCTLLLPAREFRFCAFPLEAGAFQCGPLPVLALLFLADAFSFLLLADAL
jgi:hypothetical protein